MRKVLAAAFVGMLTACSGGSGGGSSGLPSVPAASHGTGTAVFAIDDPSAAATRDATRGRAAMANVVRPQYLSTATQSIRIGITGPTDVNEVMGLTIHSSDCTRTATSVTCTLSVPGLAACTNAPTNCYTATLTTYDGANGGGNVLSAGQNVPFAITSGQNTNVNLTLAAAPVKTAVIPSTVFSQLDGSDFDLIGLGAHAFTVESRDADGNIIVGPGAPTYSFGAVSGSLAVTVTPPNASSPDEFTVTPPLTYSSNTASFSLTPTFSGQQTNGCSLSGADCSAVAVTIDMKQMLAVANGPAPTANVELYALGSASPFTSIASGIHNPTHVAADGDGNLYVADWNGLSNSAVLEFAAGSTTLTHTIAAGGYPVGLVLDPLSGTLGFPVCNSGDSYGDGSSSSCGGSGSDAFDILQSPSGGGTPTVVTSGIDWPAGAAAENGNLYVASCASCATPPGADAVLEFPHNASSPNYTYTLGDACPCPALFVDASGNVFVAETAVTPAIAEYAQGSTTIPATVITSGVGSVPLVLAGNGGNLFLANYSSTGGNVVEYVAEGTSTTHSITSGISGADALAFDASGNLWVSNAGLRTAITQYAAGSWSLASTVTAGVTDPESIAVVP